MPAAGAGGGGTAALATARMACAPGVCAPRSRPSIRARPPGDDGQLTRCEASTPLRHKTHTKGIAAATTAAAAGAAGAPLATAWPARRLERRGPPAAAPPASAAPAPPTTGLSWPCCWGGGGLPWAGLLFMEKKEDEREKKEGERELDERRPNKNTKHEEGAKSQHRGGGRIGGLEVHRLTPSHGVACLLTRQHVAA